MIVETTGKGKIFAGIIFIILTIVVLLALNNYVEQKRVKWNELKKEVLSELEKTNIPEPLEANTKQGLDNKYEANNKIANELLRKAQIYSGDTEIEKASKRWVEYKENLEKNYKILSAKFEFGDIPEPESENNIGLNAENNEALANSYIQKKENAEKYLKQLDKLSEILSSTDKKEEFEKKKDGWLNYKNKILVEKLKQVLDIGNPPNYSIFNNIDSLKIDEIYNNEIVRANNKITKIERFLPLIPNDEVLNNRLDSWKKYKDEDIHNYYNKELENIALKTSYDQIPSPPEVCNIDSSSEDNLINSYIVEEQNAQLTLINLKDFEKKHSYNCNDKINAWNTYKEDLKKRLKESIEQFLTDAPSFVNISGANDICSLENKLNSEINNAKNQIAKAQRFLEFLKGDNGIASRIKDWENYISKIKNTSYDCPNHKPICPNCSTYDGKKICPVCNGNYNSGWGIDYCDYCDDDSEHGVWGYGYNYCKSHNPICNVCGTIDGRNVLSLYK